MDLATLGLRIDSSGAASGGATAEAALNKVITSADKAKQSLKGITLDSTKVSAGATTVRDSMKDMIAEIEAASAKTAMLRAQQEQLNASKNSVASLTHEYAGMGSTIAQIIGPLAAITSVGIFKAAIADQIDFATSLGNTAAQSGLASQEFSELVFAASKFKVGMTDVGDALQRMQQQLAGDGQAISRIGLSLAEVRRQSPDQQFATIAQRISEIKGASERTTAALAIFGQAGADLLPLFMRGAEGIREAREEAVHLGVTVSGEMVAKMQAADAAIQRLSFLKQSFWQNVALGAESFAEAIGAIKAPPVIDNKDQLDDLLKRRRDFYTQLAALDKENPINKQDQVNVIRANLAKLELEINKVNTALLNLDKQNTPANAVDTSAFSKAAADLFKQQNALGGATLGAEIARIQRELDSSSNAYKNYFTTLDFLHNENLVSDQEYFAAKRAAIQQDAADQEKAIDREIAALRKSAAEEQKRLKATTGLTPDERTAAENQEKIKQIDLDKQIADLTAKRATIAANAATQIQQATGAETKAIDAAKKSYAEARTAAQAYLNVQIDQQNRALDALGKGARQQQHDEGLNAIQDKYAQQKLDLASQRQSKKIDEDTYKQQLDLIEEFQKKATDSYNKYWDDLAAKQSDFTVGVKQAVADYTDSAANVAAQANTLFTNAFSNMEDALVSFVTTGKLSFKDLANSIISDLVRIQVKALASSALQSIFGIGISSGATSAGMSTAGTTSSLGTTWTANGNAFDSGGLVNAFAAGGVVDQPTAFSFAGGSKLGVMGEAGAEGILPLRRNAKGQLGVMGGGGVNVTSNNTYNIGPGNNVAEMQSYLDKRDKMRDVKLIDDIKRGVYGKLW